MEDLVPINHQLHQQELWLAFKKQLAKDFEQSNFPTDFIATIPQEYSQLHARLMQELERNEKRTDTNIMPLLYRIDISEQQLKRYLQRNANENYWSTLAELIIKRVLQKVVTRLGY